MELGLALGNCVVARFGPSLRVELGPALGVELGVTLGGELGLVLGPEDGCPDGEVDGMTLRDPFGESYGPALGALEGVLRTQCWPV